MMCYSWSGRRFRRRTVRSSLMRKSITRRAWIRFRWALRRVPNPTRFLWILLFLMLGVSVFPLVAPVIGYGPRPPLVVRGLLNNRMTEADVVEVMRVPPGDY